MSSDEEAADDLSDGELKPDAGQRVFLIRHADASEGDKDPDHGRPLTEIGVRQAEALAERVAGWQLEAIYCSDMIRARETAGFLHRHHPSIQLIEDPIFREVSAEYPAIQASHLYIDALAMLLVRDPGQFQVIVTNNLFGDIITDIGGALQGEAQPYRGRHCG